MILKLIWPALCLRVASLARSSDRRQDRQAKIAPLEKTNHLREALGRVIAAIAEGLISASEVPSIIALLDSHVKFFELVEFERRLKALEEAIAGANQKL